jgi:hypothetical protein
VTTRYVPRVTFRLQLSANFTFHDAIGILDYLRDLGISHVYASILPSRRCSGHGYGRYRSSARGPRSVRGFMTKAMHSQRRTLQQRQRAVEAGIG